MNNLSEGKEEEPCGKGQKGLQEAACRLGIRDVTAQLQYPDTGR